jgi:Na+-driven multidrug efflux pump
MNIVISVLLTVFSQAIAEFFTNSQELIDLLKKDLWVMGLAFILIGLGAA